MLNLVPDHRLDYRVIAAEGPDAAAFLQGQLCNDLKPLSSDSDAQEAARLTQAQLSGYCNAKGRLYASFLIWLERPDLFHLLLPSALAPSLVKRLSMFVLRAKVKIRETDRAVWGAEFDEPLELSPFAHQGFTLVSANLPVQANTAGRQRLWLIGPEGSKEASEAVLSSNQAPPNFKTLAPAVWQAHEVQQGLPWVQAELSERFVPQTVNLDLLGGVSFTKGCYPGQEVVARSHYLGKLNQRMFLFQGPCGLLPGEDVFLASASPENMEPIGEVVSVSSALDTTRAFYLVSLKLEPFRGQSSVTGRIAASQEQVLLELQTLPYAVPREPQVPNRPKL